MDIDSSGDKEDEIKFEVSTSYSSKEVAGILIRFFYAKFDYYKCEKGCCFRVDRKSLETLLGTSSIYDIDLDTIKDELNKEGLILIEEDKYIAIISKKTTDKWRLVPVSMVNDAMFELKDFKKAVRFGIIYGASKETMEGIIHEKLTGTKKNDKDIYKSTENSS